MDGWLRMDDEQATWAGIVVRPNCPSCGNGGLVGSLAVIGETKHLTCLNCQASVYMTDSWEIIKIENSKGEIIG